MTTIITAEHFTLSEQTRLEIDELLSSLDPVLPEDAQLRLFLKLEGKNEMQAVLTAHLRSGDVVYTETGYKLLPLVRSVKTHLLRQLVDRKEKRVHDRKRYGRVTATDVA